MENAVSMIPASPWGRDASAPAVTPEPGPVLFLHPGILLDSAPPVTIMAGAAAPTGVGYSAGVAASAPSPEQFNRLWEAFKPSVVLTCRVSQYEPSSQLDNIGVRCRYAIDGMTSQVLADRGAAIRQWLGQRGNPPAMVLERAGVGAVPGATVARFGVGRGLTDAVVDELLAAWAARSKAVARG